MKHHFFKPTLQPGTGLFILFILFLLAGCKPAPPKSINLEQIHNPAAHHILSTGMGTISLIHQDTVKVYYHSESGNWMHDTGSDFVLPLKNEGILAMGMGTLAIKTDNTLHFYQIDQYNNWQEDSAMAFQIPSSYDRLIAGKMSWETGILGIEYKGEISFFYYYDGQWHPDPSANFAIPDGIDHCYPLGDMTLAVVDGNKVGVYFLGPEEGWEFLDQESFILLLDESYDAIIPYEPGHLAVLKNNALHFYRIDLERDAWVRLSDLAFHLN